MKYLILLFLVFITSLVWGQNNSVDSINILEKDTANTVLQNEDLTKIDSTQEKKIVKKKSQKIDSLTFFQKKLDSIWFSMYELSEQDTAHLQQLINEKIERLEFLLINTRKTGKEFALTDQFTQEAFTLFDSADRNYISSDLWSSNQERHDNYTAKEYILDYFPRYAGQKNCWIDFSNVKILSFIEQDSGKLNLVASFDSRQYVFKQEDNTIREDKRLAYFVIDRNSENWTAKIKYIDYYQPYKYYELKREPTKTYLRKLAFDNKTIKESYQNGSLLTLNWSDSTDLELESLAKKHKLDLPKMLCLELYKGDALFEVISDEIESQKSGKLLKIPMPIPSADNYKIKISSTRNRSVYAFSKPFSIVAKDRDSLPPCEELLSLDWVSVPTILTKNTTIRLKWNSNYVEHVNLYLVKGRKKHRILNHRPNQQKHTWRVPTGLSTGKYKFLLIATDCSKMQAESQTVEVVRNEAERLAKKQAKKQKRKQKKRNRRK